MGNKRYPKMIEHLPRSFQIMIFTFVKRLDSGKNCLIAIVGGTGSGKSFASVCILYWTHIYMHGEPPELGYMRDHWFFESKDFLKKMNSPEIKKKELNLWDEMGVAASHKNHQALQNKAISWLVQTFRNLEQLVIFTVPTLAFVDKSVRNLLHYQLETRKILTTSSICIIKPLEIQYNIRMDKVYHHNLFWKADDGSGFMDEIDVVGIPLPPKDFAEAYEVKSWAFKAELNKKIQGMIERASEKERLDSLVGEDAIVASLTTQQRLVWDLLNSGVDTAKEISEELNKHHSSISRTISVLKQKGLMVNKFLKSENPKKTINKINKIAPEPN